MANDRLKQAIKQAGMTVEQFADTIGVDAKTVQRWRAGRTPYLRHRQTVIAALGVTEHDLWPDLATEPDEARAPGDTATDDHPQTIDAAINGPAHDVTGSWATADDPTAPTWRDLIAGANERIDLLGETLDNVLNEVGVLHSLRQRADVGCRIRIVTMFPNLTIAPLIGRPGIEIRVADVRPGTTLRADDQITFTITIGEEGERPPPLIRLHRRQQGGLFDRLTNYHQVRWDHADAILTTVSDLDPYLEAEQELRDEEDDWDEPDQPHNHTPHQTTTHPDTDAPSLASPEPPTPTTPPDRPANPSGRRWPRRAT